MHISNSFSSPLASGVNNKLTTPVKNSARSTEPVSQIEQEKTPNNQEKSSIVINEQGIAFYEERQASVSTQAQPRNESYSSTSKDQLSAKNETAVANYQTVGNLAQRESVQKLFGVDLFA